MTAIAQFIQQLRRFVRTTDPAIPSMDDAAHGFKKGDVQHNSESGISSLCTFNDAGEAYWPPMNPYYRGDMFIEEYPLAARTIISLFNGGAGVEWTKQAGAAIADDAVNTRLGGKGIKATSTNGANTNIDHLPAQAIDLSAHGYVRILYYIDNKDNWAGGSLYLASATNMSQYFVKSLSGYPKRNGWNHYLIPKSDFTATGGPNWANIVKARISTLSTAGTTVNITYDALEAYTSQLSKPALVLTCDDRYASHFTKTAPYIYPFGWAATVAVPTWHPAEGYEYGLTEDMLRGLQNDYNWEIALHSHKHIDLTAVSLAEAERNILTGLAYLASYGIRRPMTHFTPGGLFNTDVLAMLRKYFFFNRNVNTQPATTPWPMLRPMDITCGQALNTDVSLAQAKAYIDSIKNSANGVGALCIHEIVDAGPIDGYKWLTADFHALMDYIRTVELAGQLEIKTFRQLAERKF